MADLVRAAKAFEREYSADWEDEAHAQRGEFLSRFPADDLARMPLKRYAIGQNGRETFCYWVEPGTRKWATIVGATSDKFGIYFGKTKSDPTQRFRYTKKFSRGLPEAGAHGPTYRNVRGALVELVEAGGRLDFAAIDANPLSQMLKAKTLSLYYPEKFIPICSEENLRRLASRLKLDGKSLSRVQHLVLAIQRRQAYSRNWTALKLVAFLFEHVLGYGPIYKALERTSPGANKGPSERTVDFERLMEKWRELGKRSEAYALAFEKSRLISLGHKALARRIQDRTAKPQYGYDFESFSSANRPRYIEVKTFTPIANDLSRFFVSDHELSVAQEPSKWGKYYFYLVIYNQHQEPVECQVRRADGVLEQGSFEAKTYLVKLPRKELA